MQWQDHQIIAAHLRDQACADLIVARYLLQSAEFMINGRPTSFAHAVVAKCQQVCEKSLKGYLLHTDRSFDPARGHTPLTNLTEQPRMKQQPRLAKLFTVLNRGSPQVVRDVKWLEGFAPHQPRPRIGDLTVALTPFPAGAALGEAFAGRVRYDGAAAALVVSDRTSEAERQALLALSADPTYQTAVRTACDEANRQAVGPQPSDIIPPNSEYPYWDGTGLTTPSASFTPSHHGVKGMRTALALLRVLSGTDPVSYTAPLDAFLNQYRFSSEVDVLPGV